LDKEWADSASPSNPLLGADEPNPVIVTNAGGSSPLLLVGDHAGRAIPARLGVLGLTRAQLDQHIAWDIGVAGLGERLATALDACFVRQAYSRLVSDCNRRPEHAGAIARISDGVAILGNASVDAAQALARREEIYEPYQDAIAAEIERRVRVGRVCTLVSLHSFTPVFGGVARPWTMGVLHRNDSPFSDRTLALLRRELGEAAGDNQPYSMDETDNTVPLHVARFGIDYLELEVRQDLIGDGAGQNRAALLIARVLREALAGS